MDCFQGKRLLVGGRFVEVPIMLRNNGLNMGIFNMDMGSMERESRDVMDFTCCNNELTVPTQKQYIILTIRRKGQGIFLCLVVWFNKYVSLFWLFVCCSHR